MVVRQDITWRRMLVGLGLGIVLLQFCLGLFSEPIKYSRLHSVFDAPQTFTLWGVLLLSAGCFLLASYGARKDSFLALVPIGITINAALSSIVTAFHLPFYFDTLGSMIVGIVGGPALGFLTATLTTLLLGIPAPVLVPHAISAVLAVVVAIWAAHKRYLATLGGIIATGVCFGLINVPVAWALVSFPLGGASLAGSYALADFFMLLHYSEPMAFFLQNLISEPLDKVFSLILVCLAVRFCPQRILRIFRDRQNETRINDILCEPRARVHSPLADAVANAG